MTATRTTVPSTPTATPAPPSSSGPPRAPVALMILAFAAIYLIWGSTYLAIRFAIDTMPPFLMVGCRFLAAGALLYAWVRLRGEATRTTAAEWRSAVIYGTLFFVFGNGGVTWAETRIPSGIAAVLTGMIPLWVTIVEWLSRTGPRPTALGMTGLALGFGGITLLVGIGGTSGTAIDPLGATACFLGAIGWSYATARAKSAPRPPSLLQTAAMQMLAGGAVALTLGTLTGEWRGFEIGAISTRSMLAFLYLIVFGSIVAFSAFAWLLRVTRPTRVATYAFVNPTVAVFVGWALGGETVTGRTLIAVAAVVTGVILILRSRARREASK